jgi:hypothetical protein
MRFTVTGQLKPAGQWYDAEIDTDQANGWGVVKNAHSGVIALLAGLVGHQVEASPTGPFYTLTPGDPAAILAALMQHTEVSQTSGELPDVSGDVPVGATP